MGGIRAQASRAGRKLFAQPAGRPVGRWVLRGLLASAVAAASGAAGVSRLGAEEPDAFGAALAVERAFINVVKQTEQSVVSIARIKRPRQSSGRERLNPFGLDLQNPRLGSDAVPGGPDFVPNDFGSGVIIEPEDRPGERLILTTYHVVQGGPSSEDTPTAGEDWLHVRFPNGGSAYATIVAADPRSDLAVLSVAEGGSEIRPAELTPIRLYMGDTAFQKGQLVLALGNPYAIARDGSASVSWGMISNVLRRPALPSLFTDPEVRKEQTIHHLGTLLHVDTRLELGTSGGALVNLKGELIGVTTSLAALEGNERSVGYAIPIDAGTRRIIQTLSRGQEVEYGFLGIWPDTKPSDETRRLSNGVPQRSAARVQAIIPNSPADEARLQTADLILAVNGAAVYNQYDLMRQIGLLGPGAVVRLRVWRSRDQNELTVPVELGKWPVLDDEGIISTQPRHSPWRGLSVDFPTARNKFLPNPIQYHHAVVVTSVSGGSPAERAGLREGDFITHANDVPVRTPDDFERAVRGVDKPLTLVLVGERRVEIGP